MEIKRIVTGPLATNTYLLSENKEALLIDPDGKAEKLIGQLNDLKLIGILLTHGHFDHIKAVDGLYEKFRCPVYLNPEDEQLARDKHSGEDFGLVSYLTCPLHDLKEGRMTIGPFVFDVFFTPGHTKGSVIFVFPEGIFSGDTLFRRSIGRTDLPGGDMRQLNQSLQLFRQFDRDYDIYPGHDQPTRLSEELLYNYFLN